MLASLRFIPRNLALSGFGHYGSFCLFSPPHIKSERGLMKKEKEKKFHQKSFIVEKENITCDLSAIAKIICNDWKNISFGAAHYLYAMQQPHSITENYFDDSAVNVVSYFLSNAQAWRGKVAHAVKAKLNALVNETCTPKM
jgi:hypothetical protein